MNCIPDPLAIDGAALPDLWQVNLQVDDEPMGGVALLRLADGRAVQQTAWRRRKVQFSATALLLPAFTQDWSQPHVYSGARMQPITGFSSGPQVRFDVMQALWTWTLTVEEQ